MIAQSTFDEAFPRPQDRYAFVNGADASATLEAHGRGYPATKVSTPARRSSRSAPHSSAFLNMLYVLLAFSVVVSLFGMVNTLVLSVFERTRELGMLRAIGMTRRQARRMIRHESVITALIGAAHRPATRPRPRGRRHPPALGVRRHATRCPFGALAAFTIVAILAGLAAARACPHAAPPG